jgi:hypothetical protein
MTDIEHKCLSVESGNLLKDEMHALKESISKFTPPRIIGGFKASESIQLFVAGCHPLSEGIISHLTKRFGGNVCDRQCIHILSDSVSGGGYAPKNVADLSPDSDFCSINNANQSIGSDFKDNQSIPPTNYTFRSIPGWDVNNHHPKSWVIAVTNDRGSSWTTIDRRDNNMDLNGSGIVQTFRISTPPNCDFRYIRMRSIGPTHSGTHYLGICAFELFGQLRIRESTSI